MNRGRRTLTDWLDSCTQQLLCLIALRRTTILKTTNTIQGIFYQPKKIGIHPWFHSPYLDVDSPIQRRKKVAYVYVFGMRCVNALPTVWDCNAYTEPLIAMFLSLLLHRFISIFKFDVRISPCQLIHSLLWFRFPFAYPKKKNNKLLAEKCRYYNWICYFWREWKKKTITQQIDVIQQTESFQTYQAHPDLKNKKQKIRRRSRECVYSVGLQNYNWQYKWLTVGILYYCYLSGEWLCVKAREWGMNNKAREGSHV